MTTKSHGYPTRVRVDFQSKSGWIVLDQIRTVDKKRLTKKLGSIDRKTIQKVKSIIISEFHGLARGYLPIRETLVD